MTKVKNIKKYLLAALFNAPSTIDGYYITEVNHDMPQFWQNDSGVYSHTAPDRCTCRLAGQDTGRNTDHIVFDSVCISFYWHSGKKWSVDIFNYIHETSEKATILVVASDATGN